MLEDLLGSRTRARLIASLLVAPGGRMHLRALVRATGGGVAGVQREIGRLEQMGLVRSERDAKGLRQVEIDGSHPFAGPLGEMLAADPRAQYEARIATIEHLDPLAAEALEGCVEAIVTSFDPLEIVLFGSHATGRAREDSDIDLLVVLPKVDNDHEAAVAIRGALPDTGVPVDVIPSDPARIERASTMLASVVRVATEEGVTVYERSA